jgi:putative ABC transport system ATP-binding protein
MLADAPRQGTDPVVMLENVTKVYRMGGTEVRALDGVDLKIEAGSFWAIMGPSGSGKSTMLNLLGCLDRPSSGRYLLDGREVSHLDDDALSDYRLRRLGFIFQSFNLIAQLTVLENIELPLVYLDRSPEDCSRRATELARMVGLGDRTGHRPNELSGGQQQRVAVADEPTGNLDSETSKQIMEMLMSLNQQGRTIIMVTHEAEIARYARHRIHMRDGLIEREEHDSQ